VHNTVESTRIWQSEYLFFNEPQRRRGAEYFMACYVDTLLGSKVVHRMIRPLNNRLKPDLYLKRMNDITQL
jgi:hypothetical protein